MTLPHDWRFPDDFWVIQRQARRRQNIVGKIEGEPASKGKRGTAVAAQYQRQVMDVMKLHSRHPLTGPVALDLYFRSRRRNPPTIQRAAKYFLDLLGTTLSENIEPRRRSVLYRDDRQVRFLYVNQSQGWPWEHDMHSANAGSTFLFASPARHVEADLCAAYDLYKEEDDGWVEWPSDLDSAGKSPFAIPDMPSGPEFDWLDGSPPADATPERRWMYEQVRFNSIETLQDVHLARTDAVLAYAVAGYLAHRRRREPYRDLFASTFTYHSHLLLSDPISLSLPGLPRRSGQGDAFQQAVRERFETFKASEPLLETLLTTIKLTFLVIPPEQGKDLDNIALEVLPIAHDVLKPHIVPFVRAPRIAGEPDDQWWAEIRKRLQSVNAQSVTSYQVIELPRSPRDPPEGVLRVALGRESNKSWWAAAGYYLDALIERQDPWR
jgi:hypothetical protein